ncbi:MAG TPA: hypothetical protein VKB67_03250 [Rhizomicrobium sp.]|nr:hypothetical protein [Rhizomicrobium sp.]
MRAWVIGTVLVLVSLPAAADPREDTLAGISRCASLPDDRTFLDCVYGAAQPMRAKLGLPPAPGFQTQLVPPAPYRTSLPPPMASAPTAPAAITAPAQTASVPPQQKNNGIFGSAFNGDETERMASYSFSPRGFFTVTLSNGEVWRQQSNDKTFATWGAKPSDYYVTVQGDPTGGFTLSVRGDDGLYRVQRIR